MKKTRDSRHSNTVLAAAFVLCAVGAAWAAPFDDDARLLVGADQKQSHAARERLARGGTDAVSAMVRAMGGQDHRGKSRLIGTITSMLEEHRGMKVKDEDVTEIARQIRAEPDPAWRGGWLEILRSVTGSAATRELEAFATGDVDVDVRRDAVLFIRERAPAETMFFKMKTKDTAPLVKLVAYLALAESGDQSGRDFALQVLEGSNVSYERDAAIDVLGSVGNPKDTPLLEKIASSKSENYQTRLFATRAVWTINYLQVPTTARLEYLIQSLDDTDYEHRDFASYELGRISNGQARLLLIKYMMEPGHKGYDEASKAIYARHYAGIW